MGLAAVPSIGRATLVERPSAREAATTHALYESHSRRIYSYCLHQLGSREDAEDAMQTVFMNAFKALQKGVVPQTETAWLFKIAENVCLSRRRSTWRRGRIESAADFEVIEEIVPGPSGRRDELIGIEDALAAMPEQQRRVILLREWQGLSYKEIAEEMELSQAAVETLIFRARRSLAQGLTEPEGNAAKKSRLKRALHGFDLSALVGVAKAVLGGSAAVKATAAAVAVTAAAAGTAVTVAPAVRHAIQGEKSPAIEQTWSARVTGSAGTAFGAVVASPVLAPASPARGDRSRPAAALATSAPALGDPGHTSGGGTPTSVESDHEPFTGATPAAAPEEPGADNPAFAPAGPASAPPAAKPEDSHPATPPDTGKDDGKGKSDQPAAAAPAPALPVVAAPKAGDDGKDKKGDDQKGAAPTPRAPQSSDSKKDEKPPKSDGPLYSPSSTPPLATAGQSSAPIVTSVPPASVPVSAPAAPPAEQAQREDEKRNEKTNERRDGDRGKGQREDSPAQGRGYTPTAPPT